MGFAFKKEKIILGMSGGVDSSVCAYLLKKQGYEVIGVFMQNWDSYLNNDLQGHNKKSSLTCNVSADFKDAQIVAKKLNIKIYKVDFINQYWKKVFQYLITEYKNGRTPNPDILCNRYIKFLEFSNYAKKHFGTNKIAMGHYAKTRKIGNKYYLVQSRDKEKDQTYFLSWLSQAQIENAIFPIGNLTKKQVRTIAKRIGLINYQKKDSTGICFIGERDFKSFLNNYLPYKKGPIINIINKQRIGEHDGVSFYTYGQNKGLNLSGQKTKYYVCGKDFKTNTLYVCDANNKTKYLTSQSCVVNKFNWITEKPKSKIVQIRFRHRQKLIKGKFEMQNKQLILHYAKTLAVTPGQFAVLYKGSICLGGGIVSKLRSI